MVSPGLATDILLPLLSKATNFITTTASIAGKTCYWTGMQTVPGVTASWDKGRDCTKNINLVQHPWAVKACNRTPTGEGQGPWPCNSCPILLHILSQRNPDKLPYLQTQLIAPQTGSTVNTTEKYLFQVCAGLGGRIELIWYWSVLYLF